MNYINQLKIQTIGYIAIIIAMGISYNIACYFGLREPVVLTSPYYIIVFISYSLAFIFITPLINMWFYSFKK
jgi:hypothetical protein